MTIREMFRFGAELMALAVVGMIMVAAVALLIGLTVMAWSQPAGATCYLETDPGCGPPRTRRPHYRKRSRETRKVIVIKRIAPPPPVHDDRCLKPMSAIGTEHEDLDKAKEAAARNWMARVRYEHGTRWMDIGRAEGVRYSCTRSTTGGRFTDKVAEARGVVLQECVVWAIPCRAPVDRQPPK